MRHPLTRLARVALVALVALVPALSARAAVDKNSAALVTELVTTALDKEQRFEVLSSSDVRRQLEIEANKATLGCDADSSSCLAEIAGAMGAQLVVYGKLGTLDDVVILTLNLFDSAQAKAVGRVALKEKSLSALSDRVDGGVKELIAPFTAKLASAPVGAPAGRMKLLVLDIEPPDTSAAAGAGAGDTTNAPSEPMSALFWGGVGGLAGGAVVGVVGAAFLVFANGANQAAKEDGINAVEADARYDERDTLGAVGLGGVGVGVLALGAGAVMLGLSLTE